MNKPLLPVEFCDNPGVDAVDPLLQFPAKILYWSTLDPQRPFITEVSGRRVSYGEFANEVRRWCRYFQSLGLKRGDCIASLLPISIDSYGVWLAASLLGIWEVSINRELRGEFLRHPIRNAGCKFGFVRPEDSELLVDNEVVGTSTIVVPRDGSLLAQIPPNDAWPQLHYSDVACVIYTSGTTGPAKGAVIRWAQLTSVLGRTPREWFSEKDAVYAPWPMFHVTGRTPGITMADVGGQLVLREKLSVSDFWQDVRQYQCTHATVGSAIALLLGQPPTEEDRNNPLISAYGSGTGEVILEFQRRFNVRMMLAYGSTEAGFPVVHRDVTDPLSRTTGFLRPGYQAKLIDEQGGEVVAGEVGELLIKSPVPEMMLAGYINMPDKSAEVLRDGWYHTGDMLYRLQDGGFVFVDRMRDTIRRRGENISATAFENDLLSMSEVIECAVLGIPSDISGKELLLVLRHRQGKSVDMAEFFELLKPRYPKYMLPSYIQLVDEFPKTPSGKIKKDDLLKDFSVGRGWSAPFAEK